MQRNYLFRGKRKDNDEWVYGFFICTPHVLFHDSKSFIVEVVGIESGEPISEWHEVISDTVGQLMPIKDADGLVLFEGDIVSGLRTLDDFTGIMGNIKQLFYRMVEYANTETKSVIDLPHDISYSERSPENHIRWILAGNKFDNPELLQSL
jgi:hypothetical protein